MLDNLDSIPWKQLTHAYGTAEDVPALIRALRTASPSTRGEDSPLWHLCGNIWHQGSVYEATSYAVPFLLELASNPQTPDRPGILQLLADIAKGTSFRAMLGNRLHEADFEQKKSRELTWVASAHLAVTAGFEPLVAITREQGEVRLAAAHVLAQLPEQATRVSTLLQELLAAEAQGLYRAGLLLLLGETGDRSPAVISLLVASLGSDDQAQRRAAALSIARLRPDPLPVAAHLGILEVFTAGDLEENFEGLPWDVNIDRATLLKCLDESAKSQAAANLIAAIESDKASQTQIFTLLDMLFPQRQPGFSVLLKPTELSPIQVRFVRAITDAMEAGRRFVAFFPQYRLPDSRRGWRDLAAGREPTPIDLTLPFLADPKDARRLLRPDQLKPGQRILHRHFGLGTVRQVTTAGIKTKLAIDFDEEGIKTLMLPSDGSPLGMAKIREAGNPG